MRTVEAVDRFFYGALTLLLTILCMIGTWQVRTIINHEIRIGSVEKTYVTKDDLHALATRMVVVEGRTNVAKSG